MTEARILDGRKGETAADPMEEAVWQDRTVYLPSNKPYAA